MLAKIFTASRTVERPTPKIFINSDSVGNFPPTSNRPCAICSCNRTAISSANDLFESSYPYSLSSHHLMFVQK